MMKIVRIRSRCWKTPGCPGHFVIEIQDHSASPTRQTMRAAAEKFGGRLVPCDTCGIAVGVDVHRLGERVEQELDRDPYFRGS